MKASFHRNPILIRRALWQALLLLSLISGAILPDIQRLHAQSLSGELPPMIDLEVPPQPGPGPAFLPRHGYSGLLDQLTTFAKENPQQCSELLRSWLLQRNGRLLFDGDFPDPEKELEAADRSFWIPPAEIQLRQWAKTLPDQFLNRTFQNLKDWPLDGSHPWLWVPDFEASALNALERAIESGDRKSAGILLRRQGLAEKIPEAWLKWISRSQKKPVGFRTTQGSQSLLDFESEQWEQQRWWVTSKSFEIPPTKADAGQQNQMKTVQTRRSALTGVHGLIRNDVLLIASDRAVNAFETSGEILWKWAPESSQRKPDSHPPASGIRIPVTSGTKALFQLRSRRLYQPPNTNLSVESESDQNLGWIEGHVIDLGESRVKPKASWKIPIIDEGFSLLPTPLWEGNRLFLLATKGFKNVETWIFAFDTDQQSELWRRQLETRRIDVVSFHDLRQFIGPTHVSKQGNVLSIDRSPGLIDRVCAFTGEHLSAVLTSIYRMEDQPLSLRVHWGELRLQSYPWRRPPALPVSIVVPASGLRISIPPGSKSILATQLSDGSILWEKPVGRGDSILGLSNLRDTFWLMDLHVPRDRNNLAVRRMNFAGKLITTDRLQLPLGTDPLPMPENLAEPAGLRPLILGEPVYSQDRLLIPSVAGIEWFQLDSGDSSRFMPWPSGSHGGSVFHWQRKGSIWGVIHRGDKSRGTQSRIERWSLQPPADKTEH